MLEILLDIPSSIIHIVGRAYAIMKGEGGNLHFDFLQLFHIDVDSMHEVMIFVIRNCSMDERIPCAIQRLKLYVDWSTNLVVMGL